MLTRLILAVSAASFCGGCAHSRVPGLTDPEYRSLLPYDYEYDFTLQPYLDVGGRRHQAILATGNGGQKIYLWPELDMVVVLTGGNYNRQSPAKQLLTRYILPAA
jgi:hypothetical protein